MERMILICSSICGYCLSGFGSNIMGVCDVIRDCCIEEFLVRHLLVSKGNSTGDAQALAIVKSRAIGIELATPTIIKFD